MRIAETLGEVIAVEDPEGRGKLNKFLWVRVWIDVTKPLKKGFFLKRVNEEDLWVKFTYERLPAYCYGCGRIGHMMNDCSDSDDVWKQHKGSDKNLRAEISWLDTIQYGEKQLEKLVYPRDLKRNPNMADDRDGLCDGGACQTQRESRGDEARGNTLCTEEVVHENVGNRVVQLESVQVSRPEEALLVQRIKMTAGLLDEVEQWKYQSVEDMSQVSGLGLGLTKSGPNTTTSQYFVEDPNSPRSGPLMIEGLGLDNPLGQSPIKDAGQFQAEVGQKKRALLIGWEEQNAKKGGSISTEITIPSQCSVAQRGRINSRNGSCRGGRGSRGHPRKNPYTLPNLSDQGLIEVQVEHSSELSPNSVDNCWLNDDVLFEGDPKVGAESRAPVAGPEQPRTQW